MPLRLGEHFQVSYVTRSIEDGTRYLADVLGARRLTRFEDLHGADGEPTAILNLSHFDLGGTELELIEARDPWPGSIYLDVTWGPDQVVLLHHLGFLLPSRDAWAETVRDADDEGIEIAWQMELADVAVAYLDTRARLGHYIEAVHRPEGTGPGGVKEPAPAGLT